MLHTVRQQADAPDQEKQHHAFQRSNENDSLSDPASSHQLPHRAAPPPRASHVTE